MTTTKSIKYLSLGFFSTVLLLSCTDDPVVSESSEQFTVEQASQSIDELSDTAHSDVVEMLESGGATALIDLVDLFSESTVSFNGRVNGTEKYGNAALKQRLNSFQDIFIPGNSVSSLQDSEDEDSERFDFKSNKGVYNWKPEIGDFEKSNDIIDFIQINFPTEGSSTNDASLDILQYQDVVVGEGEYSPTLIVGNIKVNSVLLVSLSFEASYLENGDPTLADVSMFLAPFDYHLKLENQQNASSALVASIGRDASPILSTQVDISFQSPDKENVSAIRGELTYRTHSISGAIDVAGIDVVEQSNSGDINDYINLSLYQRNGKVGDIILSESNTSLESEEEDYELLLIYSDGSQELLEEALEPVINELEDFLLEIEGEG